MLFETLSDHQIEAVKSEQKRILVLAGAGSEKTKTLLQKMPKTGRKYVCFLSVLREEECVKILKEKYNLK